MLAKIMIMFMLMVTIVLMNGKPSSIDYDGMRYKIDARSLQSSMNGLALAESNYQLQFNQSLPMVGWKASLRRSGARLPVVGGMPITYGETAGEGRYFCFTLEVNNNRGRSLLSELHNNLTNAETFDSNINDFCGAAVDTADALTDLNTVSLTVYTGN